MWGIFFFLPAFLFNHKLQRFQVVLAFQRIFRNNFQGTEIVTCPARCSRRLAFEKARPKTGFFFTYFLKLTLVGCVCVCVFSRDLSTSLLILFFNNHIIYIDRSFWKLIDRYVCVIGPLPQKGQPWCFVDPTDARSVGPLNKDPKRVHASMAVIWGGERVKAAVFQPLVGDGSLILEAVYRQTSSRMWGKKGNTYATS